MAAESAKLIAPSQPLVRGYFSRLDLYRSAILLYLAGLGVLLARLLVGMALAVRIAREASMDGKLFHSARCRAPLSVGLFRPRILLPDQSKHWDTAKLDAVLAHEQAHVHRLDPLVEWLAMLNRCIYWFHPLAWWLRRKLAVLAEQACDEAVLAQGHDAARYAELLVELARSVKRGGKLVAVWGSSIDGSTLAVRIRRILATGRSPALSGTRIAILAVLCAGAIVVPALVTPARTQAALALQPATSEFPPLTAGEYTSRTNQSKMQTEAGEAARDLLAAAGQEAAPRKGALPADSTLIQTGKDMLKRNQFKEARAAFELLVRNYPGSAFEPEAYFAMGNSFRNEGGKENLFRAEDYYRNFIIFFPTNPKVADAQMEIVRILMNQVQTSDRNRRELDRALAEINKFLALFPNSEYVPIVQQYKEEINRKLSESDLRPTDAVQEKSPSTQENRIADSYRKWLQEEVVYIISKEEQSAFLALTTNEEREQFIAQFWARRNPDPRATNNPAKLEHYRRLAYANEHFACGIPGWKTDRGRIYILYGEPDGKEAHPSGGTSQREFWEGGGQTRVYPFERWRYDHLAGGIGPAEFEFVDRSLDGCFPLLREARYFGVAHMNQNDSTKPPAADAEAIIGKWYLVEFAADETAIPEHRVDFVFYAEGAGYRGAVLLRTGVEKPLKSVQFDGKILRLQMMAPDGQSQAEMPWLVVTLMNGRFEGYYQNSAGAPIGPKLKLVRFPK